MGMYTELHFNAQLRQDTPKLVVNMLLYMVGPNGKPPDGPDHPLFRTSWWTWMLTSDSYYFPADTHSTMRFDDISNAWYLCVRCNFKNYNDGIGRFLDWIMPYVDELPGECLGYYRYEESLKPTIIYFEMCDRCDRWVDTDLASTHETVCFDCLTEEEADKLEEEE